jgi:hypothetical protein
MIYIYIINKIYKMIDVLYNKLTTSNDASIIEWKDINPSIYNKHSQHSIIKECESVINTLKKPIIDDVILVIPKVIDKNDKNTILNKHQPAISKKKDETSKPLNIIINETTSFNNSTEYVKETLIKMISTEEFSKIFGLTKCAEIMSGIVNNRWNKSTALFISFLLDKEVYYNDKLMIYNKEKNIGRITIAKL